MYLLLDGIPTTAKAIKVTNIQSPYTMRAYEIVKHEEKIDRIYRKLRFIDRDNFSKKDDTKFVKIGDVSSIYFIINYS